jgi:SNF2 family DNA or RNA helicase
MSKEQRRFYKELCARMLVESGDATLSVTNKVALLTRLRQVTSGFVPMEKLNRNLDIEVVQREVDKENVKAASMLNDLRQVDSSSIVVTQFTAEANWLFCLLQKEFPNKVIGINTGSRKEISTSSDVCSDILDRFKNNEIDILIANEKTIAAGFNFQNSSNMFFYSNSFSLTDRIQIEGRIDRIGQTKHPVYTDYLYNGTVDVKIYNALKDKKKLMDLIRDIPLNEWLA